MNRMNRAAVLLLLTASGQQVEVHEPHLIEDVDGMPLGVEIETHTAKLVITPELLGWTWDELGLPEGGEQ